MPRSITHRPEGTRVRHPVAPLDERHDLFHRLHVGAVAREDFISQRHPFPADHQGNADLLAVWAAVAGVPALRLRVLLGGPLEVGARHVVEQEVVLQPEEFSQALFEVLLQDRFGRQELVEGAIETVIVDFRRGHAQQLGERGAFITLLGERQLAARFAEPSQNQDQRHQRPRARFTAMQDRLVQELRQSEPLGDPQGDPGVAEGPGALDPHVLDIDFDPFGGCWRRGSHFRQRQLGGEVLSTCRQHHAAAQRLFQVPQVGDDSLAGTASGSVGFDQRPVGLAFPVATAVMTAQEHEGIVAASPARRFSTTASRRAAPCLERGTQ
jgi:hypothetical protein